MLDKKQANVIFLSYGDNSFHVNKAGVLDRHLLYAKQFNSILIFHLTKNKNLEILKFNNLTIIPVYGKNYIFSYFSFLSKYFIKKKFKNYQIVTTQDPFMTGFIGYLFKIFKGKKLHIQNHSAYLNNKLWINESYLKNKLLNEISKFLLKKADRLRVVNNLEKSAYINHLNLDKNIIDVYPVSINHLDQYDKISNSDLQNFKKKYNIHNSKLIGWAGRFVELKKINYLFKYSRLLLDRGFDVKLVLAGDSKKSFYDLKSLEKQYKVNPLYLGYLSKKDLSIFYKVIDFYLHTSNYEGYGLVMAESIMHETPVIAYRSQGVLEIIKEGYNGFIYENKKEFFQKFISLEGDRNNIIQRIKEINNLEKQKDLITENCNSIFRAF